VSTAHSSAADEDRPEPTGTSELTAIRAPGTSKPASRSAHTTPATYPAQSGTCPGRRSSSPNVTGESANADATVHSGRSTVDASTTVRIGSANGSTKPSL
jgi:hypothetical protein